MEKRNEEGRGKGGGKKGNIYMCAGFTVEGREKKTRHGLSQTKRGKKEKKALTYNLIEINQERRKEKAYTGISFRGGQEK